MNAISRLTGESTMTGSIPMTATCAAVINPVGKPVGASVTQALKKCKKCACHMKDGQVVCDHCGTEVIKEDGEDGSVIPTGAKEFTTENPLEVGRAAGAVPKNLPGAEPFIPTAVALVAPDATPEAEKPLDPTQVPQPPTPAVTVSQPQPNPAAEQPNSLDQLFKFHNQQAEESLKRAPSTTSPGAVDALLENGPGTNAAPLSATDAAAKERASKVMSSAMSGVIPPPDARSAQEITMASTAAFRQLFDRT